MLAPRYRGQAGFFEIWFLVVFDPAAGRAWWLRHSLWAPRAGTPRITIWAAAFRAGARPVVVKTLLPATGTPLDAGGCRLAADGARGAIAAGGHRVAWDLGFALPPQPETIGPGWLHRLPAPTRVSHLGSGFAVGGHVTVDGETHRLGSGRSLAKHLWGTRRVEELAWLHVPAFEGAAGDFEATQVRLHAGRPPRLATARLRLDGATVQGGPATTRIAVRGPVGLRVTVQTATRRIVADATCAPHTLAGWAYRDPAGWDVWVAQSDVAGCRLETATRAHPLAAFGPTRRLDAPIAAIEFHHRRPLPGVRYVPWDATSLADAERGAR